MTEGPTVPTNEPDARPLADVVRSLQALAEAKSNAWTALHAAAAADHARAARFLVDSGLPIDAIDAEGDTALHVCAQAGHENTARELLAAGASPGLAGAFGHTPERRAELMGHHRLAAILHAATARTVDPTATRGRDLMRRLRGLWPF